LYQVFEYLKAKIYELVAREILRRHSEFIFPFMRIGRWWDKNEEIDLVALNEETNEILLSFLARGDFVAQSKI